MKTEIWKGVPAGELAPAITSTYKYDIYEYFYVLSTLTC